jgi:CRP-like cAMP-binding protein
VAEDAAFKEGAVVYFEKDESGWIYILRSGTVELTRELSDALPRRIGAGEILGLADTLGGHERIETARAITNVSATRVDADELRGMLTNNVQIGLKVVTSLCAELREIDEMIVKRMRGGSASSLSRGSGLRMIADHFRRKGMTRAARYAYGRFLETGPVGEERLEGALHLAGLCEKDGEVEIALQIYAGLVEEFPDDARPQASYHRLKSVMDAFGNRL